MADSAQDLPVQFETTPYAWKHWNLTVEGSIARLALDVDESGGFRPGYELKLNSYDLGVDIELYDVVQRLRFEHPQVRVVMVTSDKDKVFCAGANIRMLASSSHPFKVNFCKYTNETRCSIEDASEHSNMRWIGAINGACAGGGYELALACDAIYLIDDGSSAVSLPEVPLLGVLPGTGGLTRLVDKRKIRRDLADIFCTKSEGFRARDAKRYRFIDDSFPRSKWQAGMEKISQEALAACGGAGSEQGISWSFVGGAEDWKWVSLDIDPAQRVATLTLRGPSGAPAADHDSLHAQGTESWALGAFRELEAALLELRFNHMDIGLILLRTEGDSQRVLDHDAALASIEADGSWLAREIRLFQSRTLKRLDNMSRSMFALVELGHCFAGILMELCWSADRAYMFLDEDGENSLALGPANQGVFPMANGLSRLQARFFGDAEALEEALERVGDFLDAEEAEELGLVTASPDDIDWEDEVRVAIEERASLSPDGLTGMEQNIRFVGPETCESRIYGRLSAWQNWIFQRPNAVGTQGALTLYGHPERPHFDFRRV